MNALNLNSLQLVNVAHILNIKISISSSKIDIDIHRLTSLKKPLLCNAISLNSIIHIRMAIYQQIVRLTAKTLANIVFGQLQKKRATTDCLIFAVNFNQIYLASSVSDTVRFWFFIDSFSTQTCLTSFKFCWRNFICAISSKLYWFFLIWFVQIFRKLRYKFSDGRFC